MRKNNVVLGGAVLACLVLNAPFAAAMGGKTDRDAAYYMNDLTKDGTKHDTAPTVVLPKKLLTGCAPSDSVYGSQAKGFFLTGDGVLYGFEGYPQIEAVDVYFQKKLKTDVPAAQTIFDYAEKTGLAEMRFENYPNGADFCFVAYASAGKKVRVSWAKDASLRSLNPPPAEAVKIFDAVQNMATGKAAGL